MDHRQKAVDLFLAGHNCAQAVFAAFCDVTGYDEQTALKLSSPFGGGIGRLREVCGAVSGMLMVVGATHGICDPTDPAAKMVNYQLTQTLVGRFKAEHGSYICRDLLSAVETDTAPEPSPRTAEYYAIRPCAGFVATAAAILDEFLAQ